MSFPEAESSWVPSGRSALVRELVRLGRPARKVFGVPDALLAFVDVAVTMCAIFTDDADPRPIEERFVDIERLLDSGIDWTEIQAEFDSLNRGEHTLPRWLQNMPQPAAVNFVKRVLGPSLYRRLDDAFKADLAVVVVAVRRGLRAALHYAEAIDRCLSVLAPDQVERIPGLESLARSSFLQFAVDCDAALDKAIALDLPMGTTSARPLELGAMPGPLNEIAMQLDQQVSVYSEKSIRELNDRFMSKLRGASDALQYSADPVSQAANSLIELLDRLLRDAFTNAEVLDWICEHLPARWDELTYLADGDQTRPTKLGQALCFVHAGQPPPPEQTFLQETAATALVTVRRQLQQLKHADADSPGEHEAVRDSIATIESLTVLVFELVWRGLDDDAIKSVRGRLRQAVA